METEGFFAQNTLFTRDEWLAFRQNRETTQSSADQLLKYYVAKKRLVRVRKELYAVFCKRKMHIIATEELTNPDLHFCC